MAFYRLGRTMVSVNSAAGSLFLLPLFNALPHCMGSVSLVLWDHRFVPEDLTTWLILSPPCLLSSNDSKIWSW